MGDDNGSVNVEVEPDLILDVDSDESEEDSVSLDKFQALRAKLAESGLSGMYDNAAIMNAIMKDEMAKSGDSNRLEQCAECGKYYRRLARHMMKHMNNDDYAKNLTCQLCYEKFVTKDLLDVHLKNHNGCKPFVCDICKKAFSQNCNLINHIRVHTGDKPFKCHLCDKRFTQSGNLKNHLRLHNDEKPYVCSICYQSFRQLSNLNNHSKKHPNFKESAFKRAKVISMSS